MTLSQDRIQIFFKKWTFRGLNENLEIFKNIFNLQFRPKKLTIVLQLETLSHFFPYSF
jgi:hypothetical protein